MQTFKPRVGPAGTKDALIGLAMGLIQTTVLFGAPAAIAFVLTRNLVIALAVAAAAYILFLLFAVPKLTVSTEGIRLSRVLGSPKMLRWSEITSIKLAPRSELILHGWCWPFLPFREMSPTMTSVGHFRIQFGKKWIYFPPDRPEEFLAAVRLHVNADPVTGHLQPVQTKDFS